MEDVQPYFSSDEWILLQSIDPKHKLRSEMWTDEVNKQKQMEFMKMAQEKPYLLQGTPIDETGSNLMGTHHGMPDESNPQGGFAFLPLLTTLAPIIGSVLPYAIKGIASIFQRKKEGEGSVFPPNYRGDGSVFPAGGLDLNFINKYIGSRLPVYQELEQKLGNLQGAEFWKGLKEVVRTEGRNFLDILPSVGINVGKNVAQHSADVIANKIIPKSFDLMLNKVSKKTGKGKYEGGSIISPVIKWVLRKVISKSPFLKSIRQKLHDVDQFISEEDANIKKGGNIFGNVRNAVKKVLAKILPASSKALQIASEAALKRFGVDPTAYKDMIENTIEGTTSSIGNVLEQDIAKEEKLREKMMAEIEKKKNRLEQRKERKEDFLDDLENKKQEIEMKKMSEKLFEDKKEEASKPKKKKKYGTGKKKGGRTAKKKTFSVKLL